MFAFYDLETTGTSPAFDQPLQFAAILTDDDLNPVERVDIRCRLAPHILPAPWALVRLIFSDAPEFTSTIYRSAARAAIRDRWLINEPSTPWTTKAAVEEQLHEIVSGEVLDYDRINALKDFYHARISEIDG